MEIRKTELPLNYTTTGSLNSFKFLKLSKRAHPTLIRQLIRAIREALADSILLRQFIKWKRISTRKVTIQRCPRLWSLKSISSLP